MVYSHTASNAAAALPSITILGEGDCGPFTSLFVWNMHCSIHAESPRSSLEANAYPFLILVWNLILDRASFSHMKKTQAAF